VVDNNEPNLATGGLGGDSAAEGSAASAMGNAVVNSRLSVDLTMLKGLNEELTKLDGNVKKIKDKFKSLTREAKDLTTQLNKAATAMGKMGGSAGSSGYMDTSKGMPPAASAPPPGTGGSGISTEAADAIAILAQLGIGPSGPGAAPASGGTKKTSALKTFTGSKGFEALQMAVQEIDNRVDRNKQYALPADRLSVVLQQQYNMSQGQVQRDLRDPLRQYKLGYGGINELLAMQSRTGLSARMQASSVESLRALTGYSATAGDVTQYIESMGQADTVNRMFMMTGTSLYGIGGQQKSAMQVNQELIQRLGLNNREIIQGGRQDGSVLRQRLSMAGLDQGAQDMLLQYAESNISFKERGGQGYYDPSNKTHRNIMGIEGNYATQEEETTRTEVSREEQMYKRQADNYAQMEKNLQATNKALEKFEDFLSGIIGGRTSMRGNPLAKATQMLGMGLAPFFPHIGIPLMAIGGVLGDGGEGGGTGRIQARNPTNKVRAGNQDALLSQLKPTLREPLERLMTDRPGITIMKGGAYRSPQKQDALFRSRYVKTDKKTNTYFEGSYWEKKPGEPMTAPPGLSYHEIGLAADLDFASREDVMWLQRNASKYGLDEFSRHDEPWHVQPSGIPASRRNYEEGGAPLGTDRSGTGRYQSGTTGETKETSPHGQNAGQMTSGIELSAVISSQLSIAESMASFASERQVIMFDNSPEGNFAGAGGGKNTGLADNDTKKDNKRVGKKYTPNKIPPGFYYRTTPAYGGWGYFVPKNFSSADIDALLQNETGGDYKVGGPSTTNSHGTFYGGFNISDYNWNRIKKGLAGLSSDKKGLHGKTYDTSKWADHANDTIANQRLGVEYHLDSVMAHDGYEGIVKGQVDWPGVGKLPSTYLGPGTKISTIGDPFDYSPKPALATSPTNSASLKTVTNNATFNINPTINMTTSGSIPIDANKLAKEVSKLIEREVKMMNVRTS